MRRSAKICIIIILCLIISGCGSSSQPASDEIMKPGNYIEMSERLSQKGSYEVIELGFADPDISIYNEVSTEALLMPKDIILSKDTVFRVVDTYEENYLNPHKFLQRLKAPYKDWTVTEVPMSFTENEVEYFVDDYLFLQGEPVYVILSSYQEEEESVDYYLASCNEEGNILKILGLIPKSVNPSTSYKLVIEDLAHIYAYSSAEDKVVILTPEMQTEKEIKLSSQVYGVFKDTINDIVYLNQHDSKGFSIYNIENELAVQDSEKLNSYFYQADVLSDGTLMVSDSQKLWLCKKGEEPKLLCNYALHNYLFGDIYDMEIQEDDTALIFLQYDGKDCLVKVSPAVQEEREKQEIIIAFGIQNRALLGVISRFNRQSEQYVVTAITKDENETMDDFNRAMQFEISAGKGPDILSDDFLYLGTEGYMKNGYFASLDDVLDSMEPYVTAAFEGGKIDNVLYGMPYDFRLRLAVFSENFAGNREYWTLPDFMEAVETAEPKALMKNVNAYHIILYFGLYDNSNKAYIDWENGESHLTEEPFLNLVRFAEKYGATNEVNDMDEGRSLKQNLTIGTFTDLFEIRQIAELETGFKGKPAYTGFPRTDKKGVYIQSRYLYINSSSKQIEGAKGFLRFLMSEEEQKKFLEDNTNGAGYRAEIPVNLNAIDYMIELENEYAAEEKDSKYDSELGTYYRTGLNEEQAKEFKELIINAIPSTYYAEGIENIICEELEHYFNGDKTLEDTVAILDRRVQLYLDEQK